MLRTFITLFCLLAGTAQAGELKDALPQPYDAPAIAGIHDWINSPALDAEALKGKVVLIDFWAYSCVNCVRTLPYLVEWDKKYRDKGLVIIGLHAPEFEFEKERANVEHAVKKWHITYPVALDNDMNTWNNFKNRYWPAHYLISPQGKVVYTHFGEGHYDITEHNIRALLGLGEETATPKAGDEGHKDQTPETYLGYARAAHFMSAEPMQKDADADYTFPKALPLHGWALKGKWKSDGEKITSTGPASLRLHFNSKKVFLVLGTSTGKPVDAMIKLGGEPMSTQSGKDAPAGKLTVDKHFLYELVAQNDFAENLLEITVTQPGLEAYAFTFGD